MTIKKLKSYMMPIAMLIGSVFYKYIEVLSFCTPYLIALMLFISYCNISWKEIRISRLHIWLLLIQIIGCVAVYFSIKQFNPVIAEGAMVCILAPTATSAVVITGMLGGNMESLTSYSLLSNIAVAIFAPVIFTLIGHGNYEISFLDTLTNITRKVFVLLLLPFVLAFFLNKFLPKIHFIVKKSQNISFYLWSFALIVVTAKTVKFIFDQDSSNTVTEIMIAAAALVICIVQFVLGRFLGRKFGDTVAGGQGLGQKNTILAIWMAQTYLTPIASIGPGAYVLWQNIVNSYQVWKRART